jgi:hypothetical protein
MTCPNCGREIGTASNLARHADRCLLAVLVAVLVDRNHDLTGIDLEDVDADGLWHSFGGPAADSVASQLGLPLYPPRPRCASLRPPASR